MRMIPLIIFLIAVGLFCCEMGARDAKKRRILEEQKKREEFQKWQAEREELKRKDPEFFSDEELDDDDDLLPEEFTREEQYQKYLRTGKRRYLYDRTFDEDGYGHEFRT